MPQAVEPFSHWIKLIVDRICAARGCTRQELADSLGLHIHSVSTAAYRGSIGIELVLRLAAMAKVTPDELVETELAWLRTRTDRVRDDAVRRAIDVTETLLLEVEALEKFLRKHDLLDTYRKSRRGGLEKRAKISLSEATKRLSEKVD